MGLVTLYRLVPAPTGAGRFFVVTIKSPIYPYKQQMIQELFTGVILSHYVKCYHFSFAFTLTLIYALSFFLYSHLLYHDFCNVLTPYHNILVPLHNLLSVDIS